MKTVPAGTVLVPDFANARQRFARRPDRDLGLGNRAKPKCLVKSCMRESTTRGFCKAHYLRWHRHGDPLAGGTSPGEAMKLIRETCANPPEHCVEWPYAKSPEGYGVIRVGNGRNRPAHRVALELYSGPPLSNTLDCCHACKNPSCINPKHLRFDSRQQNMADSKKAGTFPIGERHGQHKLTREEVLAIRADNAPQFEIARRYGISAGHVSELKKRQLWRWLAPAVAVLMLVVLTGASHPAG